MNSPGDVNEVRLYNQQQVEMSVNHSPHGENRQTEESRVAVDLFQKENQSIVPDQLFSFETTWRNNSSRKQVACLILKIAFPELIPGKTGFGDSRLWSVVNICQEAENEAFDFSTCHRDYESRIRCVIIRLLSDKQARVDMTFEIWKQNRALAMLNRNSTNGRGPLALPAPTAPNSRITDGHQSVGVSAMSPISYGELSRSFESSRGPLMTSTPIPGLRGKRHFDPKVSDNKDALNTLLIGAPTSKVPRLVSKKDGVIPLIPASQSKPLDHIVPRHLIKQEIKEERLSTPSSPINSMGFRPQHNSSLAITSAVDGSSHSSNRRLTYPHLQYRKPKVWRHLFMPIFNRIFGLNDSKQFKFRNDRERYHVTCYNPDGKPVARPYDLQGVQKLMSEDSYMSNPWNFITDMCWLFTVPSCTLRKNLKKQRSAKNLLKNFTEQTNKIMVDFKHCCGRQYFYFPSDMICVGRDGDVCCIPPYSKYFSLESWIVCEKCFNHKKDLTIKLKDKRTNEDKIIQKCEFEELKNDKVLTEPMVMCVNCRREYHKVCVHYLEVNSCNIYTCDLCLAARGQSREIKLRASQLPTSVLDTCIESRVKAYLKSNAVNRNVWIRVVSSMDKITEVKKGMKELYADGSFPVDCGFKLSESYAYRQKVIFAFEEIDGRDVAFFAMYVQEYGSECPPPNTRRVYISYLDSVHYFQPKELRTGVYHEILLAYLQHTKSLGFTSFHIWACPPNEGNDYIFYAHPPEQKVPKPSRLREWYKIMLDKGRKEGIVIDFKDMCEQVLDDNLLSVVQIPYLEGDFWPDCIESTIRLIEEEKTQPVVVKRASSKKKKCRSKKAAEIALEKRCETVMNSDTLSSRIMSKIYELREVFLVAYLNPPSKPLPPIVDPDPLTQPCNVDSRDSLLDTAKEHLLEFSTIRRAVHSTLMLLKECTPGLSAPENFTCNHCGKEIDENVISYTCPKCVEFDLCDSCLIINSHPHKMQARGVDIQDKILPATSTHDAQDDEPLTEHAASVSFLRFAHAAQCDDVDCPQLNCHKLKCLLFHTKECRITMRGCNHCNQLARLIFHHASFCTVPMPICSVMKCGDAKQAIRLSFSVLEEYKQFNAKISVDSTFSKLLESLKCLKPSTTVNTHMSSTINYMCTCDTITM